jgi:hypothetical protein
MIWITGLGAGGVVVGSIPQFCVAPIEVVCVVIGVSVKGSPLEGQDQELKLRDHARRRRLGVRHRRDREQDDRQRSQAPERAPRGTVGSWVRITTKWSGIECETALRFQSHAGQRSKHDPE